MEEEKQRKNGSKNKSINTHQEVKAATEGIGSHIDPCVICLDTVSERAITSPCRHHSFDFLCLVSWLQERSKCPLCLTEVRSVENDFGKSPENFKVYKVISSAREITSSPVPSRLSHLSNGPRRISSWRLRTNHNHPPVNPNAALLRRKDIYLESLYSLHVGSNRLSRFRDLTPRLFVQDQELVSRAKSWIRRELQVFQFLNSGVGKEGVIKRANNAEFLLEYVIFSIKTSPILI